MPKTSVDQWDLNPANNTDIDGISIAEGCPASGINDAIRTLMAQIKAGVLRLSGGAMTGAITGMSTGSTVKDDAGTERYVGYRAIPATTKTSAYVLALGDVGKCIDITTGGVTVPPNSSVAFLVGDTIAIYNNSASAQTVTQGSGVTLRLAGSAITGNRSLAQRGMCSVRKVATDEWVIMGAGVS